MKVVSPMMSGQVRGRWGGVIYNAHRGINVIRGFTSPTQPNSALQLAARALLGSLSALWAAVTSGNRANWATYADAHLLADWTGVPKRLTAMNWWIKTNALLLRMGIAQKDTVPATAAPALPTGLVLSKVTADIKLAWTAPVAATFQLEVRHYGTHGAAVAPSYERSTFKQFILAETVSPVVVLAAAPVGYHSFWVRACDEATGLASGWTLLTFLMT